mmetsp:Transcript_25198/g.37092  ORF Transcript_25198/g.37092 Transcript_25198/m.37092 type:complete len:167 (+) Transcript_25198:75-575(+)|eukprot:CAMPEP_0195518792 /NCGR_PEP_ID=MMETSP0794_2-20130614/13684_1 /TAXON_ID=515487 /ORGANISM="Stephanopyxis turris, Strain CCMP 815" /LENGTH=166 /DNA_ID=CAMNT_0040647817 /DNA_START=67 /DNA_END=567 /DNA_ORIENTATION=+
MRSATIVLSLLSLMGVCNAFAPKISPKAKVNNEMDLKKAVMGSFAALTIASNVLTAPVADAVDFSFGSSTVVSEKIVREGLYRDYEVDITQQVDDARSTFKDAKETKSKKGKYTALLSVLVVGSFIIPMAQYFWYVKDDNSSDEFFAAQNIPDPEPEPKKKGWFGK